MSLLSALLASACLAATRAFQYPYQDPALSIPARTANLLSLLTLDEKVSLLQSDAPAISRIALPAYSIGRECERGDSSGPRATVFPSGAALAATWDADLVFAVARLTALEARANANTGGSNSASCYGPVVNYIHDVRWGRTNEMLTGEDTTLGSVLGAAFVRGLQSWTEATPQGLRLAVTSTVKHLLSYSGPEGTGFTFGPEARRFGFNAVFTNERAWREFFHPVFRATAKAGARGFMCSYSAFSTEDGALTNSPACGSPELLADTVRGEWGFDGMVLSDAGAVVFIGLADIGGVIIGHNATPSDAASAVRAITAGCDIELTCCGAPAVYPTLTASVAGGALPAAAIDTALSRILRNRLELGELDPPASHAWQAWGRANVTTPEMVALSADAAAAAIVLLKNEGGLLPLSAAALEGKTLALIGPLGDDAYGVIGGYANRNPPFVRTFLDGLREGFPLSAVAFHAACADAACAAYNASALAVAAGADVVVAALGTTGFYKPGANNESTACGCPVGNAIEGECCDRRDTELPGAQLALLQALAALGKPLVLVVNSGSVVSLRWPAAAPAVAAILHAPFLGMSAGVGLARVLTGATPPSGKTTLSWYADAARDLPPMEDYSDASLYNRTYRYTSAPVTYPFGYGRSYAEFSYSSLSIAPPAPRACDDITLTVTVHNLSPTGSYEVVQAYGTLLNSTAHHVPRRQLLAFARVYVPGGGSAAAVLTVPPAAHAVLRGAPDMQSTVEPGAIALRVAGSSDPDAFPGSSGSGVAGRVEVVGPPAPLAQCG